MTGHAVQSVHTQSARYSYAFDYTSQLTGLCGAPIARGGYSVVRKCYLYGEPVAVKELKANVGCLPMSEMAEREYELWHSLKHPNILPLKGICYLCPDRKVPSFISSWQKNGRINDYVRGVPEADFLRLNEDIAEGVRYLHDNGIIHGDLRAANVLISDDHRALVTDFGIAKYDSGDGVQISKAFQGNFRWMACEFFKCEAREFPAREARRSKESDVWMFAMLMQEILSGKIPFHEYINVFSIASMIGAGRLPVFPSAQHRSWAKFDKPVRDLCSRCCTSEPKKRPTIVAILKEIRDIRTQLKQTEPTYSDHAPAEIRTEMQGTPSRPHPRHVREADDNTVRLSSLFSSLRLSSPVSTSTRHSRNWSQEDSCETSRSLAAASRVARDGSNIILEERPHTFPFHTASNETDPLPRGPDNDRFRLSTICPTVELENYLARRGLQLRFTEKFEPSGPEEQRTWHCVLKFDGRELARASAWKKSDAKKVASRTALTKLCGLSHTPAYEDVASRSDSASDPQFRYEGPDHNRTWICTFSNGKNSVSEGRGKTKNEAKQNARLQISFSMSRALIT